MLRRNLYQRAVEAYPADPEARGGLGWTLLKLRKNKEVEAAFRVVLDFAPKNLLAQQGMAALNGK